MKKTGTMTIAVLALLVFSAKTPAQNRGITNTGSSPHARLRNVDLDDVKWTTGFWADRFAMVRDTTLEHLYKRAADPERGSIRNLEIAAGLREGEYSGNNWMDAWVYKWLEAASAVYGATGDEELDRLMDSVIAIIVKAQQPDGYIASQNIVRDRPRFQMPGHHECYVMGHLMTAACVHNRMTGKKDFLHVAEKAGDFLYLQFKDKNPRMAHFPVNPSMIMGAVELYRTTGDKKYLELANTVIDMRGAFEGGSDQHQDKIPLRDEKEVVGHNVFYTYLFSGAADAYMETGDETLLVALNRLWDDLVQHKLYITGGTCALHHGLSIRQGRGWRADMVHEAVGAKYFLPNSTAYNETCGQVGNSLWNWRMLAITGDARFTDVMETEMFNGFLPSISLDGTRFFYTNPLRWYGEEHPLLSQDNYQRSEIGMRNVGTCCPTNTLRALAEMQNYLYSTGEDGLWIHHYGGSEFDNATYRVVQKTDYPWDGTVSLIFERIPKAGAVFVRIPRWAEGFSVRVNGERYPLPEETGVYAKIERTWKKGDTVTLDLPMPVRLMRAHNRVEETYNQVAVMRGPLVYCLESADLPDGVSVLDIVVPHDIHLTPRFDAGLLGGVTVLEGEAGRIRSSGDRLYYELEEFEMEPVPIRLIPYFAWANRGIGEMTVWMPVRW